jgi:hypothetical protein
VGADEREADDGLGGLGGLVPQDKRGPAEAVESEVSHPDTRPLAGAEGEDRAVSEPTHREHPRVVGVEHGRAAGRQTPHQLALGRGDRLARPELAQVGLADVGHHGDVGGDQTGQLGDVTDVPGTHLQDQEAGGRVGAQHGERYAELVVERARGRDGRCRGRQHRLDHVLGAGLALRAGDGDHGQIVAQQRDDVGGQALQRGLRVVDDDGRQRRRPGSERGDRARLGGLGCVLVAVGVLARERDEEAARVGLSTVDHGRGAHGHRAVADDLPADQRGDFVQAEGNHPVSVQIPVLSPRIR